MWLLFLYVKMKRKKKPNTTQTQAQVRVKLCIFQTNTVPNEKIKKLHIFKYSMLTVFFFLLSFPTRRRAFLRRWTCFVPDYSKTCFFSALKSRVCVCVLVILICKSESEASHGQWTDTRMTTALHKENATNLQFVHACWHLIDFVFDSSTKHISPVVKDRAAGTLSEPSQIICSLRSYESIRNFYF